MLNLLRKELRLAVHPTSWIFLGLSLMLLIPSYPYYVAFFYTGLGIFFTCLSARENQDISYMLLLPLPKHDVVRARFVSSVLMELLQVATAAFTLVLHHFLIQTSNPVGMDANIALLGLALVELGLFNLVFFPLYYKNPQKVGVPFLIAGIAVFLYIFVAEAAAHVVPFVQDVLDTPDPAHLSDKIAVLVIGLLLFAIETFAAQRISEKRFKKEDC